MRPAEADPMNINHIKKEIQMDKTTSTEFVITHITESGTAFGVRTDNGESIHISPRLLEQANADIDHLCDGIIVPNTVELQRERTPWVAVYVRKTSHAINILEPHALKQAHQLKNTSNNERTWQDVSDEVIAFLQSAEITYCETGDISEAVNMESRKLSNLLEHMHSQGKICKAEVRQKADQDRVSMALWSIDIGVYQ